MSALCPGGIRTNRATRDMIERQGWAGRLTCRFPDEVARAGLRGLFRGRAVIVPGMANRMLARVSPFVPAGVSMSVVSRRWETKGRTGARAHPVGAACVAPAASSV